MWYLARRTPESAPDVLNLDPLAPYGIFFGKPLVGWAGAVTVKVTRLSGIPDLWWVGAYLLASRKCLSVLRGLGETGYEEFPVTLVDTRGRRDLDSLRVLNLLGNVSCVDAERSRYETDEDGIITRFLELRLAEQRLPPGRHMFRLEEKETIILISDACAASFEAEGMTGVRVLPVDRAE